MTEPNEQLDPKAPDGLIDGLRDLYRTEATIPAEIDRAVLGRARRHFAYRRRLRWALRWGGAAAAAAAVLVVVLFLEPVIRSRRPTPTLVKQDIDRNGRVDILDAFALARYLETDRKLSKQWDVNADGTVDRADVETVAFAAVSLKKGS